MCVYFDKYHKEKAIWERRIECCVFVALVIRVGAYSTQGDQKQVMWKCDIWAETWGSIMINEDNIWKTTLKDRAARVNSLSCEQVFCLFFFKPTIN